MMSWAASFVLATALLAWFPADMEGVELLAQGRTYNPGMLEPGVWLWGQGGDELANSAPKKIVEESFGVVTSARSVLVVDTASGAALYAKGAHAPRSIGSLTKLMSAYVFLEGDPDLRSRAELTRDDVRIGGIQHLFLGDLVSVHDLLLSSLAGSDNSATVALVRLSGHSLEAHVARMNELAVQWGMTRTTFADVTGLSQANRSTATDIALMLSRVLQNEVLAEATREPLISIVGDARTYTFENTNELLFGFLHKAPYRIVGGKTGFLPEAGYSLGAVFEREDKGQVTVVALGGPTKHSRFQDVKSLAYWAFQSYDWP